MGNFTSLKPDSPENLEFWNANKDIIRALFEELNQEVFNNKWIIRENYTKWDITEHINPNITLCSSKNYTDSEGRALGSNFFIGVCVARGGKKQLKVTVYHHVHVGDMRHSSIEISPQFLTSTILGMAKILLDAGAS